MLCTLSNQVHALYNGECSNRVKQKFCYSLRTECERYNSRLKNTGQERMWVRNQQSVANLNTITHFRRSGAYVSFAMPELQLFFKSGFQPPDLIFYQCVLLISINHFLFRCRHHCRNSIKKLPQDHHP